MNFMEELFVWAFIFFFLFSFTTAAENWEEINVEGVNQETATENQESGEVVDATLDYIAPVSEDVLKEEGKFFTRDFYIALGLIVFVLVIVWIFIWLFIRGPKNKWE